jgi:hypothetical protein
MKIRTTTAACAVAAAIGPACAGISAVGEFAGELYETFEGIATPGGQPGPMPIFGGAGTLNDSLANTVIIAFNWNGPSGTVLPYNGNLMGGLPAGVAVFEFDTAVTDFGGYINTVGPVGGGSASFWDEAGNLIDTVSFAGGPVEWTWIGWTSDVGISRIELSGPVPGFGFQLDDLTINQVPAPGGAAVVGVGALIAGRRRRD